jgi:hypothetical protein
MCRIGTKNKFTKLSACFHRSPLLTPFTTAGCTDHRLSLVRFRINGAKTCCCLDLYTMALLYRTVAARFTRNWLRCGNCGVIRCVVVGRVFGQITLDTIVSIPLVPTHRRIHATRTKLFESRYPSSHFVAVMDFPLFLCHDVSQYFGCGPLGHCCQLSG